MMQAHLATLIALACLTADLQADELLFQDDFKGKLGEGWSWAREHREAWRATEQGLEVRIEPGNMWGPQNNAKNVLVRAAPDATTNELEISVKVENKPTNQYEQVDLVWYYDDGNMVKLGEELVDGKLSVVMGREEKDKTRTVAIIPLDSTSVRLRFFVKGNRIRGQFRPASAGQWQDVGECDLPAPVHAAGRISVQCYQGSEKAEHWARISEFRVRRRSANDH
jgi:regulation of enolase protein 1 (concanavalin A-like superfamily)